MKKYLLVLSCYGFGEFSNAWCLNFKADLLKTLCVFDHLPEEIEFFP